ncbi:MAG: AMP-binding protein [Candidatus Binataceae bacterium]|jgi:crotonobetaine/carnitine-CoA ligase
MLELGRDCWTLINLVRAQAEKYGDREFLRFKDRAGLSFRDLDTLSSSLAASFAVNGVKPGDRIVAVLENCPELFLSLIAANKVGAVFVPLNTQLKGAFLEHQLKNSAPCLVIVDNQTSPLFETVDLSGLDFQTVIVVGRPREDDSRRFANRELRSFADVARNENVLSAIHDPLPSDVSTVIYTSGTTGPSKGVMMPHGHCYLLGYNLAKVMRLTEDDIYYVCMPLFHTNALFMQMIGSLIAGSRAVLAPRFTATNWLADVRSYGATVTNALGVMPEFIFRQPPTPDDRDHKLRAVMAVPIAAEWGHQFEERFGLRLVQGFGLTEANIVAYTNLEDPLEPGCCGPILDDWYDVRVVQPSSDEELPVGQTGEIVVRPKYPSIFMSGYFRMPERTVDAWRNLWFHTGDAGYFDARGRLFFVDRIKDCIRRRGENISSYEVEQVISSHPAVEESAVVAAKSEMGGEDEVKACVVVRPGHGLAPEELLDFCQERMPRYAVPRYVDFVDSLPKTPTGKVRKEELRRARAGGGAWDREAVGYVLRR